MDETFMLICLSLLMLVGSYLAGNIPLVVNLSEEKLRIVTILGAGLLVGTALSVIIPEGIASLYEDDHHRHEIGNNENEKSLTTADLEKKSPHENFTDHSSTIGLSLVLGFVFMLLIDQISQRHVKQTASLTATLGLVVHAAADGVALGAAATTSHSDVEMIIFLAIMLHKAPAAFGLTSFLLHEGVDRHRIRKHLGIFSLSAPLLALLTYFGIGQEQKETLNSMNGTGIAMLFSAGTFLYVATVHVLPELTQNTHSHGSLKKTGGGPAYLHVEDGDNGNNVPKGFGGLRNAELIVMVIGALLPTIITLGHHH